MDLWQIPAVDQHAHNLLCPEAAARRPYAAAFTEGHAPEIVARFARQTLCFRRSLREVAALLGCEATEEAVLARRAGLGLENLTATCLGAAQLGAVLLDDGFLPDESLPLAWHERFVPVRRVLRLESVAERCLGEARDFEDFLERFTGRIDPPPREVVAFKSIAAYRTGLDVRPVPAAAARASFAALQPSARRGPVRLADKPLLDFLLGRALEVAAGRRLPVQLHTGFGDPDLDLRLANPLHLRPLLEDPRYRAAPLVLLHASYPFAREAGYLASVYPQVHLDFGLAVPMLSVAGMWQAVGMLLELAPSGKVLYSSDAHFIPELFYLAARWGRKILGDILGGAIADGDLTTGEAEEIAAGVLRDNARRLYAL
jgi:predicted TIM-barrel fold metal-dependent hydrolase